MTLTDKLRELERFIEEQSRYHAFRKYSYPFLRQWLNEVKAIVEGCGNGNASK